MKPSAFAYHRPRSLDEALDLLAAHADTAKLLAGGQSLVPVMNMRLAAPAELIDINDLPGLLLASPVAPAKRRRSPDPA